MKNGVRHKKIQLEPATTGRYCSEMCVSGRFWDLDVQIQLFPPWNPRHRGHLAVACLWVSKSMEQGPVKTVGKIMSICFGAIFREFVVTTCNNVKQWWGICHAKRLGSVPRVTCQCRGMTRSSLHVSTRGPASFFANHPPVFLQTIRHWVGLYDIPCKSWANHEKTFTVWCHQWWLENPRTVHGVLMGKSSG